MKAEKSMVKILRPSFILPHPLIRMKNRWIYSKMDYFLFHKKIPKFWKFFINLISKKGLKFFWMDSFVELDNLYQTMWKYPRKKNLLDFEFPAPYQEMRLYMTEAKVVSRKIRTLVWMQTFIRFYLKKKYKNAQSFLRKVVTRKLIFALIPKSFLIA